MRRWTFATGLVAVLTYLGDQYIPGKPSVSQPSTTAVERPEETLNRVANDPTAEHADRAAAVFALFKQYIKPGHDLPQVRRVLRNRRWLEEAKLYYFPYIGGWIPVDFNFQDRTYSLHLFADKEGYSEWVIYFQLAGGSEWGKWQEDGLAFLRGQAGSRGKSQIKEFALRYPDGKIDVFRGR